MVECVTSARLLSAVCGRKLTWRLRGVLPQDVRYTYPFYEPIQVNSRSTRLVLSVEKRSNL